MSRWNVDQVWTNLIAGQNQGMPNGRRALELIDLMRASPGKQVDDKLTGLQTSLYTFELNYRQLTQALNHYESADNFDLWHLQQHDRLHMAMFEITRLLHNVVAAAKTLVDHTRIISRELLEAGSVEAKAYQTRIDDDFAADPLVGFVEDLRNYCLHRGNPPLSFTFSMKDPQAEGEQTFSIDKESFLTFGWSAKAVEFLEGSSKQIDFDAILETYRAKVLGLHKWFHDHTRDAHKDALRDLKKMEDEYVLIGLEDNIAFWRSQPTDDPAQRVSNLFASALDPQDLRHLDTIEGAQERMEAAIELLKSNVQVPDALIDRLRQLIL